MARPTMTRYWTNLAQVGIALTMLMADSMSVAAQEELQRIGSAVISYASGGSVQIPRGMRVISRNSDLQLEWVMVNDSSLGIVFNEPVGAKGVFDDPYFRYAVDLKMRALVPVRAFETRVLTFNVWREFTGTLAFTQLENLDRGQQKDFDVLWGWYGESALRAHRTSVAYVSRVILEDGRVLVVDPTPALTAAQRIQESLTLQDLEPKPEPILAIS